MLKHFRSYFLLNAFLCCSFLSRLDSKNYRVLFSVFFCFVVILFSVLKISFCCYFFAAVCMHLALVPMFFFRQRSIVSLQFIFATHLFKLYHEHDIHAGSWEWSVWANSSVQWKLTENRAKWKQKIWNNKQEKLKEKRKVVTGKHKKLSHSQFFQFLFRHCSGFYDCNVFNCRQKFAFLLVCLPFAILWVSFCFSLLFIFFWYHFFTFCKMNLWIAILIAANEQ